ncbi:MAG: hypothetical protein ACYS30_18410 [Planctomycetota bacterium]
MLDSSYAANPYRLWLDLEKCDLCYAGQVGASKVVPTHARRGVPEGLRQHLRRNSSVLESTRSSLIC